LWGGDVSIITFFSATPEQQKTRNDASVFGRWHFVKQRGNATSGGGLMVWFNAFM
jgi:hypothetical protein